MLLARLFINLRVDGSIGDRGESGLSLLRVRAVVLAKRLEGISPSCPTMLVLICSFFSLLCKIFISIYCLFLSSRSILVNNSLIQMAFFAASVSATYSTSLDNEAIVVCLLEYLLTGPQFSMRINLNIDFIKKSSSTQFELKKPLIIKSLSSCPYIIIKVQVALRYHIIVFTTSMYWRDRFLIKRLITEVAKAISDWVSTLENITDFVMSWYCSYLALPTSEPLFGRSIPSFIGVLYSLA